MIRRRGHRNPRPCQRKEIDPEPGQEAFESENGKGKHLFVMLNAMVTSFKAAIDKQSGGRDGREH